MYSENASMAEHDGPIRVDEQLRHVDGKANPASRSTRHASRLEEVEHGEHAGDDGKRHLAAEAVRHEPVLAPVAR